MLVWRTITHSFCQPRRFLSFLLRIKFDFKVLLASEIIGIEIMSLLFEQRREKPAFCICENKDADQLRGNREADQRLCFPYTDSKIPLLSKIVISSF